MKNEAQADNLNKQHIDPAFDYVIAPFAVSQLNSSFILRHCSELISTESRGFFDMQPETISVNNVVFNNASPSSVTVTYFDDSLILSCQCSQEKRKLCSHQARALYNIMEREELRAFFDDELRTNLIRTAAREFGLEHENKLDNFFTIEYNNKRVNVLPLRKELLSFSNEARNIFQQSLLPKQHGQIADKDGNNLQKFIVLKQHKYYGHLYIELLEAPFSQQGKVKNPLQPISPFEETWHANNNTAIKFFAAINSFQQNYSVQKNASFIEALKAIAVNPLQLPIYYHRAESSENVIASSIAPVQLHCLKNNIQLNVQEKNQFYEISCHVQLHNKWVDIAYLALKYDYFILSDENLFLIDDFDILRVVDFFKQHHYKLVLHASRYKEFQRDILTPLENKIRISYEYMQKATQQQIEDNGFNQPIVRILYLTDSHNYIRFSPVIRYGDVEIPVLSRRQIYAVDSKGSAFTIQRNEEAELAFTALLLKQHPDFFEQLDYDYLYLHKDRFLENDWFLDAFEQWRNENITILGFNQLTNNRLNENKAKISIEVTSGINWFNTSVYARFGKQKASIKELHKSNRNKSRYVQLDDGTLGIIPDEWLAKFAQFFEAGDIAGDSIQTPKINFSEITEMYEQQMLSHEAKEEIDLYKAKFANFDEIEDVEIPEGFTGTLRHYQQQGLNWLNFLDDFNFGGCLADDMGLGKSAQIIAFILSQRKKNKQNTNLLVVPTSLLFNWQQEIAKFAPSLKLFIHYGSRRANHVKDFNQYEVVITTYGSILSDARFLKEYTFNYIFLDESQLIKNPGSQRYQSVCLLKAKNKIIITGTPLENSTFDLYGQLSFACPGLFGSKQHFRDLYAIPIDRFKDDKRAAKLQQKINPFVLRRTKKQVAKELPDKTEMVIYCEMEAEQRKLYDVHEKEFREFLSARSDEDLPKSALHVLKGLTTLRQICNSPALVKDAAYAHTSAKMDALLEQIENKSPQHKILVFSQFVSMLNLIKKELEKRNISFAYLTGSTRNREAVVDSFQTDSNVRVFLISLKAGGVGLNLTEADYVYLVDPWWNPAVENQAIDRCYRIGQNKKVIAVRMICMDTVEEKIMKMQQAKTLLADGLIKTDANMLKSFTREDLLNLLK